MSSFPLSQRDSYATECTSRVVSCTPSKKKGLYEVVLSDTVLFAEGGGQPSDCGALNGLLVDAMRQDGTTVVHILKAPLEVGSEVRVTLDWNRRFDHMQQHSAQHVITAIASREPFRHDTVAWALHPDRAVVELTPAQGAPAELDLAALEAAVNNAIRAHTDVTIKTYDADSVPAEIRSRGAVPKSGEIRIVTVEGVDSATCCGTHVRNTADLQAVKLLGTERARAGTLRITFLAGGRVLSALGAALDTERALKDKLCCNPADFVTRVSNALEENTQLLKQRKKMLAELAEHDARELLKSLNESPKHVATLIRAERGIEWAEAAATCALAQANMPDAVVVIAGSDGPNPEGAGIVFVMGEPSRVEQAGKAAKEQCGARGGAKKGSPKWQGKATNVEKVSAIAAALSE
eukprot:m51a1_g8989 putative alanyl-trna editing protein aarsd1 (407) ;mRNA; r:78182-79742